ncbi:GNAT family N-acetyltransferase [Fulvivirga maritima]|uniref:GNAT family N-acetyltransferase n=1 Tax=Fulvivirga maritima TaxID=2904247 RepID=UPI001F454A36|nr:GNAT family N-acetyltransferase [Fulvivirga maritima]UII25403.1 GNAT family N-acetyltransferase [Fulvivirga maritima]
MNTQTNINKEPVFTKHIEGYGTFTLHPFDLEADSPFIHDCVNREYARYWDMIGTSLEEVKQTYSEIINGHTQAYIGSFDGEKAFLLEKYDPSQDMIADYYEVKPGDCGMHILVGPAQQPKSNFTWYVFTTIMDFIFNDNSVTRIVVEPDIRNEKIHKLNSRAGFKYDKKLNLPHKTAHLAFCSKDDYQGAVAGEFNKNSSKADDQNIPFNGGSAVSHLSQANWQKANVMFIKKAIAEFTHELILQPHLVQKEASENHHYALSADKPGVVYYFQAKKMALDHWSIDENTISKKLNNEPADLDGLSFILDFKEQLGIPKEMLPTYLEEISSTLYGSAYMLEKKSISAADLINSGYQEIEHAMTAGHPCFVANNGRIGFDTKDYKVFAPEANTPFNIIWLAGHVDRTHYAHVEELPYQTLLEQELGEEQVNVFNAHLSNKGLNPADYFFIPVHPWQWFNKLASIFSPDIANEKLVYLGESKDLYSAQQSIRTLYNISNTHKFYVKTSLSILNMGFMRGLSPYYMGGTPAITEWVQEVFGNDEYLKSQGFEMLGEVATMGYRNLYFEELGKTNAYNKMLAALWRESPMNKLEEGQSLMTMAALLHVDNEGAAVVSELIKASGLSVEQWLKSYLKCYLKPLLHCFYKYDTVFMPHGENIILIMENHVPVKAIMKDITEEMQVLSDEIELPEEVKRIYADVPHSVRLLSIFTDVFDCFFRFLSAIMEEHGVCNEEAFWNAVADCIHEYQSEWPEFNQKFTEHDLFAEDFARSCLNRLQLKNNKQMVDLSDPAAALQFHGTLINPIASNKENQLTNLNTYGNEAK